MNVLTRRRGAPSTAAVELVEAWLERHFDVPRPKFDRLDDGEQLELLALSREATTPAGGLNRSALAESRVRDKFEKLLAKAAGLPKDHFKELRKKEKALAEIRDLATEAQRRPISRAEQRGLFDEIAEQIATNCMRAEQLGLLAALCVCWHTGKPLGAGRVENGADGPTLIVDANAGPLNGVFDPRGTVNPRWKQSLRQLERNSWVTVAQNGREWRVSMGTRARRAFDQRGPAK